MDSHSITLAAFVAIYKGQGVDFWLYNVSGLNFLPVCIPDHRNVAGFAGCNRPDL